MMDPRHDHGFQMPHMQPPQLMNPPPQIFGAYDHEGLPLAASLPDMSGSIFGDGTLLDESNEAKRRRIARACDMCRKKKIKCDGKMPACTHCINYKTECVFTQVEKKRNPPKGAKYIEGLENRLGRMESLLRLSGLLSEDDNGRTDLGTLEKRLAEKAQSRRASAVPGSDPASPSHSHTQSHNTPNDAASGSTPRSALASPEPHPHPQPSQTKAGETRASTAEPEKPAEEVEQLSDMMCSLVTNNCGETRYIGSSSGFSIFSPKGIQWVNQKTGDSSFQEMISASSVDDNKWMYWKPEVFGDIFKRRIFRQLPPKAEAVSLLKDFFENFNCMFPLFHQPTFMHLVERQYSRDPYEGSGWWASLNVALAIAHRLRVMSNLVPQEEDEKAWGYLKNALAVFTELTLRNTDLLSVQAILGMALFLQGTPNPQPSFFMVAAAIRASHSIGLHKRGSGFNLNPVEIEQRKRVFWIGYMLDKDICLRSGRPPVQDDDDMNVELPSEDPEDNIGNIPLADGKGKVNLFRLMCEFATIESKVYKQLYSVKASKQSDGELLNTIGELDHQLEEWKDSIPVDFRPEHEIKASHTPLILHVVVLHFAYYNCLTTIHRMSIHHGYWTSRLSNYAIQGLNAKPLNPRVFSSAALCVSAARASIHLIKYVPQGDFSCVWLILYFPVSALVTLFGNILQNPQDPRARSDVRLMNLVVSFLSMLNSDEENGGVRRMLGVCSEFERIAKVVLDKAEKESSSRRKRKTHDDPKTKMSHPQQLPQTPLMNSGPTPMSGVFSPSLSNHNLQSGYSPNTMNGSPNSGVWQTDYGNGTEYMTPTNHGMTPFADMQGYTNGNEINSPLTTNSFQQPFVPQDLWQMPMTLEWDWAEMTGDQYPSFENGLVGDPNLHSANNQHLQHQGR
ncbi:fungal-specific transcription factor domain-containing protein [Bisporella sp. PMI_857]|nr:fungal-specific transcription factor domain-containing protein [Bisporella sp. PMI_857]